MMPSTSASLSHRLHAKAPFFDFPPGGSEGNLQKDGDIQGVLSKDPRSFSRTGSAPSALNANSNSGHSAQCVCARVCVNCQVTQFNFRVLELWACVLLKPLESRIWGFLLGNSGSPGRQGTTTKSTDTSSEAQKANSSSGVQRVLLALQKTPPA